MYLDKFPYHNVYVERPEYHYCNYLIFELNTNTPEPAYMKHPIFREPDSDIHIVFVQSIKFLKVWQNSYFPQEPHLSFGNEEVWRKDRDFKHAESGFSKGRNNPVPLAEIACEKYIKQTPLYKKSFFCFSRQVGYTEEHKTGCSFINGITRTIWLLANGVNQFPVYVRSEKEAILLAKYAGIYPEAYYGLNEINLELESKVNNSIKLYFD